MYNHQIGIRISSKWESIDADQASGSEEEDEMTSVVYYCILLLYSNILGTIN